MINRWHLAAAALLLCINANSAAQSAEQRKEISKLTQADELARLGVELQAKFERDEARVFAYLSMHPEQLRSFEKSGRTYYLARIGADGSPVYITAKGASSPINRRSAAPAVVAPPPGEGSR